MRRRGGTTGPSVKAGLLLTHWSRLRNDPPLPKWVRFPGNGGGDCIRHLATLGGDTRASSFICFDLLAAGPRDLWGTSTEERRQRLREVIGARPHLIPYPVFSDGDALFAACAARGLKGAVAKRAGSLYKPEAAAGLGQGEALAGVHHSLAGDPARGRHALPGPRGRRRRRWRGAEGHGLKAHDPSPGCGRPGRLRAWGVAQICTRV